MPKIRCKLHENTTIAERGAGDGWTVWAISTVLLLEICSCAAHPPSRPISHWVVSHRRTKWMYKDKPSKPFEMYDALLNATSVKGRGNRAVLDLEFEGNNIPWATELMGYRITSPRCWVQIALPCTAIPEDQYDGMGIQSSFDGGTPKTLQWVPDSKGEWAAIDGLIPDGDASFILAVERHQTLRMQIPCGPYDSSVVNFDIDGLRKALIAGGMK